MNGHTIHKLWKARKVDRYKVRKTNLATGLLPSRRIQGTLEVVLGVAGLLSSRRIQGTLEVVLGAVGLLPSRRIQGTIEVFLELKLAKTTVAPFWLPHYLI